MSYFLKLEDFGDDANDDNKIYINNDNYYNENRLKYKHYLDNHYVKKNDNNDNSNSHFNRNSEPFNYEGKSDNNQNHFMKNSSITHQKNNNTVINTDLGSSHSSQVGRVDMEMKSNSVLKSHEINYTENHNERNNIYYNSDINYKSYDINNEYKDENNFDHDYNNRDNDNIDNDDYIENKVIKYDEDDTNNFLNYEIYERKRPSHIYTYENENLKPPNYSSLPPSPPSSSSSSSSSTTSFSTSYSGSLSSSPSSSIVSSTTNSPRSLNREITKNEKEKERERDREKEENFLYFQTENLTKRDKISIQGLNFLPSNKIGFYDLEKNDEKSDEKKEKIHDGERNQKNLRPNYIDFQVVLSDADFTILEQRKLNQHRVLQYNDMK